MFYERLESAMRAMTDSPTTERGVPLPTCDDSEEEIIELDEWAPGFNENTTVAHNFARQLRANDENDTPVVSTATRQQQNPRTTLHSTETKRQETPKTTLYTPPIQSKLQTA